MVCVTVVIKVQVVGVSLETNQETPEAITTTILHQAGNLIHSLYSLQSLNHLHLYHRACIAVYKGKVP